MARKQNKTARGQTFDMDLFTNKRSDALALGNLGGGKPVNARGDILGKGGNIEVKREEAVRKYYREELPTTKTTPLSKAGMATTTHSVEETPVFKTPETAWAELTKSASVKEELEKKTTRRGKSENTNDSD